MGKVIELKPCRFDEQAMCGKSCKYGLYDDVNSMCYMDVLYRERDKAVKIIQEITKMLQDCIKHVDEVNAEEEAEVRKRGRQQL